MREHGPWLSSLLLDGRNLKVGIRHCEMSSHLWNSFIAKIVSQFFPSSASYTHNCLQEVSKKWPVSKVRTAAAFLYQCSMLATLAHHDQCCGWKIQAPASRPLSGDCHESFLAISWLLRWYKRGIKINSFSAKRPTMKKLRGLVKHQLDHRYPF